MKTQPYRDIMVGFTGADNVTELTAEEQIMELEEHLIVQRYEYKLEILKAQKNAFLLGLFIGAIVSIIYIFTK